MNEEHQHEKVVTKTPQDDGSVLIDTSSYYEKLSAATQEIEKHLPVSRRTILKEIVDCLELITRDGSPELTICIKAKGGEPVLLTRRHTVSKVRYGKR